MKTLHKFTLPMLERVSINMPTVNKVLFGELQEGFICIWALVDTESKVEPKEFAMYKTGQEVSLPFDSLRYIGTAKVNVGMELGMHLFEVIESKDSGPQPYTTV